MSLRLLAIVVIALCLVPSQAWGAISLQKNLPLSARDMEYYYQRKDPVVLPAMLRAFERAKSFARPETRMMVATFLAEVVRADGKALAPILPLAKEFSLDGRRTLCWMAHFAALPNEGELLQQWLGPHDEILKRMIVQSPRRIASWDFYGEKTVLSMYWAAYFASQNATCLDAIIQAAQHYARLNARGRQKERIFPLCQAAAASLYELAPRHEAVRKRIAATLTGLSGPEADTLRVILRLKQVGK